MTQPPRPKVSPRLLSCLYGPPRRYPWSVFGWPPALSSVPKVKVSDLPPQWGFTSCSWSFLFQGLVQVLPGALGGLSDFTLSLT